MRVLHVISSSGMYGAEAVILTLARTLAEGPHTCALGVFDNAANPNRQLYDAARAAGIETYLIPCAGQIDRTTINAIRTVAASTGAELVHAHGYKADIYCFLALRRRNVPLVSTCHTWYDTDRMVTLYGKLDRFVLRSFTSVVAVSNEVRERLLAAGVNANRIHVVRNGIDVRPFADALPSLRDGLPPDALLVGLIGRLAWEKGVDIYLAAASRVLAEFPAARFVIVGEGPDRAALEAKCNALGLHSAISFVGRRDDMPSVYASLDLMVSASRQEGLPIALLEGMASGLPVVATAVGEVPTVIRNKSIGLLVPPEDPDALANAILTLLRDPGRRIQLSAAARELIAADYSADRMAADYACIYEQALASKARSTPGVKDEKPLARGTGRRSISRRPRVFMMDLWATVPYYTAYLSRALLRESVDLRVGSITYYLDPKCFSSRGIRTRPGLINLVGRFRLARTPRRILKLIESLINLAALSVRFLFLPPDIIHVQYLPMLTSRFPVDLWFIRFCKARRSAIVLTVHDLLPHDSGLAHKAAFQALYARVDALICHSASIRDRLVTEFSVPAAKISVIPHGPFFYDLPQSAGPELLRAHPPDSLLVLWQGIIFPYKGIDLLIEAWKRVEERTTNARLIIAGTGQPGLLDQIRSQVSQLGLQRVKLEFRFISAEELVGLYRAADIVVYPYRAITTSGALATGLALGKTIIATDLPVFRELLTDGENASLVSPPRSNADRSVQTADDSVCVTALADTLLKLIENPALREQLAVRVRAMNFGDQSWSRIACETLDTYRSVL